MKSVILNNKKFNIEKATINHTDTIMSLEIANFNKYMQHDRKYIRSSLLSKYAEVYVIYTEKMVAIGYYSIVHKVLNGILSLESICINRDYRRMGIASYILSTIELQAINHQYSKISLYVAENNIAAIELYKKFGFKKQIAIQSYYADNVWAFYMIKNLDLENLFPAEESSLIFV